MATFGQCDCCEKIAYLRRKWPWSVETFACAVCCGCEADEFDPEELVDEEQDI